MLTKNKAKKQEAIGQLTRLVPYPDAQIKVVSQQQYQHLSYPKKQVQLLLVNDFQKNFDQIEQLQNAAVKEMIANPQADGINVDILTPR